MSLLVHEARKNGLCAPPRTAGQSEQLQTFAAKSQQKPSVVANLRLADSLSAAEPSSKMCGERERRVREAGGGEADEEGEEEDEEEEGGAPDWCDGRAQ